MNTKAFLVALSACLTTSLLFVVYSNNSWQCRGKNGADKHGSETGCFDQTLQIQSQEQSAELPTARFDPPLVKEVSPFMFYPCNQVPMAESQVVKEKLLLDKYKERLTKWKEPPLPYKAGTKGIVITCNLDVSCLANLLHLVKFHQTQLPIELWMARHELTPAHESLLRRLFGQRVIPKVFEEYDDIYVNATTPLIAREKRPFHYKLMAMAMSQFQEVMLFDRDFYLIQKPEQAFKTSQENGAGAMFWHDMTGVCPTNPIWKLVGAKPILGYSQDSCIVYLDKAVAWRGLYLAAYMNQKQSVFYRLLFGDKDTFFISFESLGLKYSWPPFAPYLLRSTDQKTESTVRSLHPDISGKPLGVHLGVLTCNTTLDPNFIKYLWTYDPNEYRVVGWSRIVSPYVHKDDTSTIVPSKDYIGNFPDIISLCICTAQELLGSTIRK